MHDKRFLIRVWFICFPWLIVDTAAFICQFLAVIVWTGNNFADLLCRDGSHVGVAGRVKGDAQGRGGAELIGGGRDAFPAAQAPAGEPR